MKLAAQARKHYLGTNYLASVYSSGALQPYSAVLTVDFSCTADSLLLHLPSSTVMAEISRTEKVQLHAPDLEELRGGKDISFDIQTKWHRRVCEIGYS